MKSYAEDTQMKCKAVKFENTSLSFIGQLHLLLIKYTS